MSYAINAKTQTNERQCQYVVFSANGLSWSDFPFRYMKNRLRDNAYSSFDRRQHSSSHSALSSTLVKKKKKERK
ncbi:hypothetical protein M406DRAFT_64108 [Cryphonectria parasitica EP155]|uniref:Uncharacterized protein n=1 Tax=Cryphonectria parasitica (strain ATCC 38755 / EP155) TaxID=660469 RepID=A0A9P4XUG8_CRYP1|nr:uncharacterized protein M406DRAFT_64108 [Cryphonectria parasitica EP155]KAF3761051.1 hypothetical protein M406DRAFT_64108 [Cryphonectria parasitica EP155]